MLNLSIFYDDTDPNIRTFLERYLRLTCCDLFFADATVLVEGNVERLLLPQMIASAAPRLQSTYLTVLEIGGAFGYRFKALIEFLGLTALVITDLDSVFAAPFAEAGEDGAAGTVAAPALVEIDVPVEAEAEAEAEDDDDKDEDEGSRRPAAPRNPARRALRAIPAQQRPTGRCCNGCHGAARSPLHGRRPRTTAPSPGPTTMRR